MAGRKPKTTNEQIAEVSKDQKTIPGLTVMGGVIEQSDYDSTTTYQTKQQDYSDMLNGDAMISASINILLYPIINSDYRIDPGVYESEKPNDLATEVAEYINSCFKNLFPSYREYIYHIVQAIPKGFIMFEKLWGMRDYNGKMNKAIIRLSPIQYDTVYRWNYDDKGYFNNVDLYKKIPNKGIETVNVSADTLHVFTPFPEFGNIEGRPILRPIRQVAKYKGNLWKGLTRAVSRGAGIPEIKLMETGNRTVDSALKAKADVIARTIGNSENAGVITQYDKDGKAILGFELHGLEGQSNGLALIQQANTEIVYNTLTQFIISGIGQNGSRSATDSHKSPYLEALNTYCKLIEENQSALICEMVEQSYYYGKIDPLEYPKFKIVRMVEKDLESVAKNLIGIYSAGLAQKRPEDELHIRALFDLPEVSKEELEEEDEKPVDENQAITEKNTDSVPANSEQNSAEDTDGDDEETAELGKCGCGKDHDPRIIALANGQYPSGKTDAEIKSRVYYCDTEQCRNQLDKGRQSAQAVIEEVYSKVVDDIAKQLAADPNKKIELRHKREMYDKLMNVYQSQVRAGVEDVRKEQDTKTGRTELAAAKPITIAPASKKVSVMIDLLYDGLKNSVAKDLAFTNEATIAAAGGIEKWVHELQDDNLKGLKTSLETVVESGYNEGRNQELDNEGVDRRTYLIYPEGEGDGKNCEVCYPYNGLELTKQDAESLGLNWDGTPLNSGCLGLLGGNQCRCIWA
jgi:hypothetical protein